MAKNKNDEYMAIGIRGSEANELCVSREGTER